MTNAKRTVPRWPIALAAGVIIAALGTLAWLRAQLIESEKSVVRSAVQRFQVTDVLGRPESSSLIFGEIETQARVSEGSAIRELYVTEALMAIWDVPSPATSFRVPIPLGSADREPGSRKSPTASALSWEGELLA